MSDALGRLGELLSPPNDWDSAARRTKSERWEAKVHMLVMGWPSLAATLAELLEESGQRVPTALKRAYQILDKEPSDEVA